MIEVRDYLKESKSFFLATVEENGQPRVRAFGGVSDFEGKLYISTQNEKKVFQQIMKNPKIEICAVYKDTWIRIEAEAIHDDRREARAKMLEDNPFLNRISSADDGLMAVLYLKGANATISSRAGEQKIIKF